MTPLNWLLLPGDINGLSGVIFLVLLEGSFKNKCIASHPGGGVQFYRIINCSARKLDNDLKEIHEFGYNCVKIS